MELFHRIRFIFSSLLQFFKRPRQRARMDAFIRAEIDSIAVLPKQQGKKQGTLIIKCDDIGDFMMWQQVIPLIVGQAEKPLYFVTTRVNKPLLENFFDFADQYIWIDKSRWDDKAYREENYQKVRELNVSAAFTTLFTRNMKMDDMLLLASDASRRAAWDLSHHAYFPGYSMDGVTTETIVSSKPIELEYFRNIELVNKIYGTSMERRFVPLFPSFGKQKRLVVVPVASAGSRCWNPAYYAQVITAVLPLFDSVLLLGGNDSVETCKIIEDACGSPKVMNLAGQTKLHDMVPFIGESKMLLCPDTFALHIAVNTCTDVVVVSNGTNWQRFTNYAPYVPSYARVVYPGFFKAKKQNIKVIYSRSEIQAVKPEQVIEAIRERAKEY